MQCLVDSRARSSAPGPAFGPDTTTLLPIPRKCALRKVPWWELAQPGALLWRCSTTSFPLDEETTALATIDRNGHVGQAAGTRGTSGSERLAEESRSEGRVLLIKAKLVDPVHFTNSWLVGTTVVSEGLELSAQ